ncbi:MAG: Xaa-Pro aminopeptidase [Acidobacteriia bacterium]|nr:Xaa-Pro aminopeptidase [Terriglobia bacterium]
MFPRSGPIQVRSSYCTVRRVRPSTQRSSSCAGFFVGAVSRHGIRTSIRTAALVLLLWASGALPLRAGEPSEVFHARRVKLMDQVKDGVIVLFGLKESENPGADLTPFRQEDEFYYLTGWQEPGAVLMLLPKGRQNIATALFPSEHTVREILFLPERDPVRERYTGPKMDALNKQALEVTGLPLVLPLGRFPGELTNALSSGGRIYTLFPAPGSDIRISREEEKVEMLRTAAPFAEIHDVRRSLDNLRLTKDKSEMELLRKAVEASVDAHLDAAREIRSGVMEYQIAARLRYTWESEGCDRAAYAPIVGSGINSTTLHYNKNSAEMKSGDTVVIDAAAECGGYAADITRTFPVSGKFSPRQKEIYELVLGAQNAAFKSILPGKTTLRDLTDLAREYFKKSPLRGPKGPTDTLDNYFIHGIGHWIGLNVHDVGDSSHPIDKNMVFTIEPGIYIPDEKLGVRIEDDYAVDDQGRVIKLSARLGSSIEEVERMMKAEPIKKAAAPESEPPSQSRKSF